MSANYRPADSDKVVVVTGAAQGIGYAIAERFVGLGVRAVVMTDRNEGGGQAAADRLGADFLPLDVSDSSAVAHTAGVVWDRYGAIHVLINNAGVAHENPAVEVSDEIWARVLAVDLTGTFVACREFGRYFLQQRHGSIVNISSIAAFIGTWPEYHIAYDVAKAGVSQIARSLAVEWSQYGIRVNAVAPGRTKTPILDTVGMADPNRMREWVEQIPQRRLLDPTEIATTVAFVALADASAITGQTIVADGGQVIA